MERITGNRRHIQYHFEARVERRERESSLDDLIIASMIPQVQECHQHVRQSSKLQQIHSRDAVLCVHFISMVHEYECDLDQQEYKQERLDAAKVEEDLASLFHRPTIHSIAHQTRELIGERE